MIPIVIEDIPGADMAVQEADTLSFVTEWEQWHREHEVVLADEHGFLAITAIHWLTAEAQRFDDAPGAWLTGPDGAMVVLDRGEDLVVDGRRIRDLHSFGQIPERGSVNAVSGDAVIEVARRGGRDIIRPRHPQHPLRLSFVGVTSTGP
jgi:uncharacterized protein (DUF1684 family)